MRSDCRHCGHNVMYHEPFGGCAVCMCHEFAGWALDGDFWAWWL